MTLQTNKLECLYLVQVSCTIWVSRGRFVEPRNTKGGSITEQLTSFLRISLFCKMKTKIVSCHTAYSKPVKQEVNGTVILPPLVFPD
jgi:hypothetical protein